MQELYQRIKPGSNGNNNVLIEMVRRVENYREAIQFLQTLESIDRYGRKFVVLDCSAALASEIIIQHVKDVHLGRRNYHYLLSGLVSLILSSFFPPIIISRTSVKSSLRRERNEKSVESFSLTLGTGGRS